MPDLQNESFQETFEREKELAAKKYPSIFDIGETITKEEAEALGSYKRVNYQDKEKTPELLNQVLVDGVISYQIKLRFDRGTTSEARDFLVLSVDTPQIKQISVLVPATMVGKVDSSFLPALVGKKVKVVITDFIEAYDGKYNDDKNRYVVLGSLVYAQNMIADCLYEQYLKDKDAFLNQVRKASVFHVISMDSLVGVVLNYQGFHFLMLEIDYRFHTSLKPLIKDAPIGKNVEFKFTSFDIDDNYSDGKHTDNQNKYKVRASRVATLPNLNERIHAFYLSEAKISAYIVEVDPVKGILVEIAPGWQLKATPVDYMQDQKFSALDAFKHTQVTVQIKEIEFDFNNTNPSYIADKHNYRGHCVILSAPNGVAEI